MHGLGAEKWENVIGEPGKNLVAVIFYPSILLLVVPLTGHNFKAILGFGNHSGLYSLFVRSGVDALGKQFFGLLSALTGIFQAHSGIVPKTEGFLFAVR